MKKSKRQKGPSLYLSTSSRESSPYCPSVLSDWDADDEDFMSSGEYLSRPLSVAIPSGPYCPRRPTLSEILTNSAPPPWTLAAFMAYLSQNHCLETLEFTMDASRYRKQYDSLVNGQSGELVSSDTEGCDYVRMLWQKLLDAYIAPNGPREVNLPSHIRDHLLRLPNDDAPPHPSVLDPAVRIIYELMDESVLVPFLNSVAPYRGPDSCSSPWTSTDDMQEGLSPYGRSYDSRTYSPARSRNRRDRSPPSSGSSMDVSQVRYSQQSYLSASMHRGSRPPPHVSYSSTTSSMSDVHEAALTDDSGSSVSPTMGSLEPMTPPTTPPTSDAGFLGTSPGTSPKNARGEGSGWKKMGAKLGWKKSKSSREGHASTSSGRYASESRAIDEDEDMS